tara:strand:+ start:4117 stop:4248 length:132 start_codon:yes stop_codon:yes gene_type:complete
MNGIMRKIMGKSSAITGEDIFKILIICRKKEDLLKCLKMFQSI